MLLERIGARFHLADGYILLSAVCAVQGDLTAAREYLAGGIEGYRELGIWIGMSGAVQVAALLAFWTGDADEAARLAKAAERMRESYETQAAPTNILHLPDPAVLSREALGEERYEAVAAEGGRLTEAEAVERALLVGLGAEAGRIG